MATTGENLAGKMAEKGVGKRRLAMDSGVARRTVDRVLSGDRIGYLDTWLRFAAALGCEVSDLTGERDGRYGA